MSVTIFGGGGGAEHVGVNLANGFTNHGHQVFIITDIHQKTNYLFTGRFIFTIYRIKLRRQSIKLGFCIPINVFGPSLSIAHYGSIVVNQNTIVGRYFRLHNGVNY